MVKCEMAHMGVWSNNRDGGSGLVVSKKPTDKDEWEECSKRKTRDG